jgi:hypothetical protein
MHNGCVGPNYVLFFLLQSLALLFHLHVQLHRIVDCVYSCDVTIPSSGLVIVLMGGFLYPRSLLTSSSGSCCLHYCLFISCNCCYVFYALGFPPGSWPRRSYFDAPHHVCKRCAACFWYRERNKSLSSYMLLPCWKDVPPSSSKLAFSFT